MHLSDERDVPFPPSIVWAALVDLASWSAWNHVTADAPEGLAVGRPLRLRIPLPLGRLRATASLVAVEPERELRWRGGVPGLFVGVHGFLLTPTAGGTRVEHAEVFSGLFVRPVTRLLGLDQAAYGAVTARLAGHLGGTRTASG